MIDKAKYDPDEELNTRQAAAEAKVDRRTIVSWIHKGILNAYRNPGLRGHYRVLWKDLYQVLHTPAVPRD